MSGWVLAIEGTPAGTRWALILALTSAVLHAIFGALQKGRLPPWQARGAIDAMIVVFAAPVALFVVPWPQGWEWGVLAGAMVIHFLYKVGVAMSYERAAYTVVYPVIRGTGPLFTIAGAYLVFGEVFTPGQWLGVAVLVAGLFGLSAYNLRKIDVARETLVPALALAVATGLTVAIYTTWDAFGIRMTPDPFTFLAWFFFLTALDFPLIGLAHWRRDPHRVPLPRALGMGAVGALVAFGSFGSVILATRLDKVGEAAVLRETSTVFAALIGWLVLKETVGPRRLALMALIAAGAVIVEAAG
ncbi:MAG: EamA family transporter [Shimia sp.]